MSYPDEHFSPLRSRSLNSNALYGVDANGIGTYTAEGIHALCEGLKGSAVTSLTLDSNKIGVEGAMAIAAVLKDSQLSTLGCAATPNLHSACTRHTPLNT